MAAHQAPPSLGFSRQEQWSGLPFPSPMHESEKWKCSHSIVSDSEWPHGLKPTRLLDPWDFPGKSTGVGRQCLLRFLILIWGNSGGLNWTNISYKDHHLFLTMSKGFHQHGTISDFWEVKGQAQILHLAPCPSKSNDSSHATCIMLYLHLLSPGLPQLQIPAVHQQDKVDMFRVIALPSTEV